jgi:hypothetical protein
VLDQMVGWLQADRTVCIDKMVGWLEADLAACVGSNGWVARG